MVQGNRKSDLLYTWLYELRKNFHETEKLLYPWDMKIELAINFVNNTAFGAHEIVMAFAYKTDLVS